VYYSITSISNLIKFNYTDTRHYNINRKSHTVFQLVLTSVTLKGLERHNSPYFASFHQIRWLWRLITSQWLKIDLYCLQNIVFHFQAKLSHPSPWSLCDSWAACFVNVKPRYLLQNI